MDLADGFTKCYQVHLLVWYEIHEMMESAIKREKQLKNWSRSAKIRLLEQNNQDWRDLWDELAPSHHAAGSYNDLIANASRMENLEN